MQREPVEPDHRAEDAERASAKPASRGKHAVDQPNGIPNRLLQASRTISRSTGWMRTAIAFAAGAFSVLAMAPVEFWPVLFVTLPSLIWLIDGASDTASPIRQAAKDGWWFGFGYFFFGLFWVGEAFLVEAHIFGWLLPFAITVMPAGLALFTAAAFAFAQFLWRPGLARILIFAVCIAIAEYLRGHLFTGFPWNILGYALTSNLALMQSAGLFGIYGLTLWTILIVAVPLVTWVDAVARPGQNWLKSALVPILVLSLAPLAAMYAYGLWVIPAGPLPTVSGVKIRIVQPSVPQHHKWARDKQAEIFADHLLLSKTDENGRLDNMQGATHVVWPEAAMPFLPLATPQALTAIGDLLPDEKYLIAGALRLEGSKPGDEVRPSVKARNQVYNSLIVFGSDGAPVTLYDKIHLVPFGEYLPFRETMDALGLEALTRIRGGFAVGPSPRPLLGVPRLPAIGPLICYEAIFPAAIVQGNERPGVLINVTNDGWFGNITGPFQHFQQSRLRAVEEGLPLVRAANNGISALIDPYGRIVKSIGLNERGVIDVALPHPVKRGVYGSCGEWCFIMSLLQFVIVACGLIIFPSEKKA
ncbi:MAG: apolipoprotein N-acyltransferase [Alphaproteobacteria bacterium]|nr:apolipoprotein N-acyltransferase [Alphaproteobacteria bacterium]